MMRGMRSSATSSVASRSDTRRLASRSDIRQANSDTASATAITPVPATIDVVSVASASSRASSVATVLCST